MCKVICITNRNLVKGDFFKQIERVASSKPFAIILREKDLDIQEYSLLAESVNSICNKYNITLILHKYVDVAMKLKIKNIHMPMESLKAMTPWQKQYFNNIGASVHSVEQSLEAKMLGATYVTASHIFETKCKQGLKPKGTALIKDIKNAVDIPVFALGGIASHNFMQCIDAGSNGVCIMSGLMESENPCEVMKKFNN
jgi:thiamine-phosphate pyrophosphorylase